MSFENAIYQWQQGERRLRAAPAERGALLERVTETLVAELRRRLGGRFSAEELVGAVRARHRLVPAGRDEGGPGRSMGVGLGHRRRCRLRADTCARPPTTPAAAGRSTPRLSLESVRRAADDDLVLLDEDLDRAVAGPVLGVDRVVLDGGVEPQAVALLAVVEGALEGTGVVARRSRRPRPPRRLRRRLGVASCWSVVAPPSSSPSSSSRRSFRLQPLGLDLGRLQLGGDQRVVLGAQVDLLVVRGARAGATVASSSLESSFWRLNCSMSCTLTSSWWATQASVRPCRTQVRIWFKCGRRDLRAMDGPGD